MCGISSGQKSLERRIGGQACKPDSVRRAARKGSCVAAIIPLRPSSRGDSSGLPEGWCGASCDDAAVGPGQPSPPIWPCTTRGLPCRPDCSRRGGLLPHLFTLAMRAAYGRPPGGFASQPSPSRRTGGIFSVALSVAVPPRHAVRTRLLRPGALALPGALPLKSPALRPRTAVSGLSSRPASREASPAITRPARHSLVCHVQAVSAVEGSDAGTLRATFPLRRSTNHAPTRQSNSAATIAPYSRGFRTSDFTSQ